MIDLRVLLLLSGLLLLIWITPTLKAQAKGRKGEERVRHKLAQEGITAMHDVLFPKGKGDKLVQIDHLVLTASGIVVLETKDWGGTFTDPGQGKNWVQRMGYKYPRTYYRHSPVEQNKGHHYALAKIISPWKLSDLVVMAGDCRFEGGFPEHVVPLRDLIPELKKKGLDPTRAHPGVLEDWAKLKAACRNGAKDRKKQMCQVTRSRWRFYREYYSQLALAAGLGLILLGILV